MKINIYMLILVINCLLAAFSQVLLKTSANKKNTNIIFQYLNLYVIIAYIIFILVILINIFLMKNISMVMVSIFSESLPLVFSVFTGYFIFKEKISINKVIGITIIVMGIILISIME